MHVSLQSPECGLGCHLQEYQPLPFRPGLSLAQGPAIRRGWLVSLGILLSLLPPHQDGKHVPPHLAFLCGF